jgi:hypothetical protein
MGRRKNNPDLVDELIEGRWTMDQDEVEEKYYSLSSSDMSKVAEAIDGMQDEDPDGLYDDDDDEDGESLSVYDAAEIWRSNGMDEDYTFGYTEDELRDALR